MNMKKGLFVCVLLALTLLIGCTGRLAEAFDAQIVEDTAKTFIERLDIDEFETGVEDFIREDLREALSAQVLRDAYAQVRPDAGAFVDYKDAGVTGQHDRESDTDLAIAVIQAEYENQTIIYTVIFDTNMWITGFYLR